MHTIRNSAMTVTIDEVGAQLQSSLPPMAQSTSGTATPPIGPAGLPFCSPTWAALQTTVIHTAEKNTR